MSDFKVPDIKEIQVYELEDGQFRRLWCAPSKGPGIDHDIICPKCLSNKWVDTDLPTCAKCERVDLIDHSTCIEGKCTNA